MIPLKDDAPRIGTPYVTYALLALNTLAFLFEYWLGKQDTLAVNGLIFQLGVVPCALHRGAVQSWLRALGPRLATGYALRSAHGGHPSHFHIDVPARRMAASDLQYVGVVDLRRQRGRLSRAFTLFAALLRLRNCSGAAAHAVQYCLDRAQRRRQRCDCRGDGSVLPVVSASTRVDPGAVLLRLFHMAAGLDCARLLVCRAVSRSEE